MDKKYNEYISAIRQQLDDYRFNHSLAVAKKAVELAKLYSEDIEKAYVAGLLHDITKNEDDAWQLKFFDSSAIMLKDYEKVSPKVWHSISAAHYIKINLGITDNDIINAVRYHTTGRVDMSLLEKIVYLADFTSEDRTYPDVDILRKKTLSNLDDALLYALRHTIVTLSQKTMAIHPDTLAAYNQIICKGK
ncbi:MAG: HD domain-containing protein [Ruminococcaceae bacterium]|nr:HD domain-containing protein [Oscillospiraceae bacterium]